MDFDWSSLTETFGWRGLLIAVIVLCALYFLTVFLRLLLLKPRRDAADEADATDDVDDDLKEDGAAESGRLSAATERSTPYIGGEDDDLTYARPRAGSEAAAAAAPVRTSDTKPPRYVEHRHLDAVEHDVADLYEEVKNLRAELRAVRNDLQQQVDRLKAVQTTSPLYSDAMQLALLGHDATSIAEKCGIAVAEAELVVALAHNRDGDTE